MDHDSFALVSRFQHRVEDIADQQDAQRHDTDEGGDQLRLQRLAQDDHFWGGQRDHAHHEGEHRAECRALAHQRLDDGDDAGGVGVHRHADGDRCRHRPPGCVLAHDRGHEVLRDATVDAGNRKALRRRGFAGKVRGHQSGDWPTTTCTVFPGGKTDNGGLLVLNAILGFPHGN
jgi:hypothetical protein